MEHVPRIQVHEGSDKVETVNGNQGHQDDTSCTLTTEETLDEILTRVERNLFSNRSVESADNQVSRKDQDVTLNDTKDHERGDIGELGTLRSVTQREDELQDHKGQIDVTEQRVDNRRSSITKGPAMVLSRLAGRDNRGTDKFHDDNGGQIVGSQRKPGEDDVEEVVDELDVEEEHADDVVTTLVHTPEVHQRVQGGSK